jgi:hypothetical protein
VCIVVVEHTGFEKLTGMQDGVIRSAKRWKWCVNVDEPQIDVVNRFPRIDHKYILGIIPAITIKNDLVMKVPKHNRRFICCNQNIAALRKFCECWILTVLFHDDGDVPSRPLKAEVCRATGRGRQ